jgi:hypothetical protein
MNRQAHEHLIRAAAEVTDEYEFAVIGCQSILGPVAVTADTALRLGLFFSA